MERHEIMEIMEAITELKLYGMRAGFDEITGKGMARRDDIYPLIASLIRAEHIHRQARSISYRIGGAKFTLEGCEHFTDRGLRGVQRDRRARYVVVVRDDLAYRAQLLQGHAITNLTWAYNYKSLLGMEWKA